MPHSSEEKCPAEYKMCSLVTATITFEHLQSVQPGSLKRHVLSNAQQLGDSVTSLSDGFAVTYIGEPVVDAQFEITLVGLSEQMVAIQRRYFERISSEFLAQFVDGLPVYEVEVLEENVDGKIAETAGGTTQDGTRNLAHSSLRGSARQLQAALRVSISAHGSGALSDLRASVVDAVDSNKDRYMNELRLQQLRPGEINENSFGSFFNNISDTKISLLAADSGGGGGGNTDNSTDSDISPVWMPVSIIGVIVSSLWIIYKCYDDFLRPPKAEKLDDSEHTPSDHQNEDDDTSHQQQSFDELPAGEKRRQSSLDRFPMHKGPRMVAPVNTAGRNGRGLPGRSSSMGGVPRSLDRHLLGKGTNDANGAAPTRRLGRASSNQSLPGVLNVSDSKALPKRGKRPPSLDRLLSENNARPPRRFNSTVSVPAIATPSNTNPENGERPQSPDSVWKENLEQKNIPEAGNSSKSPTKMTEADSKPISLNSTASSAASESGGIKIPKQMDSSLLKASTSSSSREPVREVTKTRSMEGLSSTQNPCQSMPIGGMDRLPVGKEPTMEAPVYMDSSISDASTSFSRQLVRGVKSTRSMEGLSSTKNPRRIMPMEGIPRSLDRVPVGKGPTMEAPVNMDSSLSGASSSSSSHQPVRGVKKTRSMEGLSSTKKAKDTSSNTTPEEGERPPSMAPLWNENSSQSGNSRESPISLTEANRTPMLSNSTASSAASEPGGVASYWQVYNYYEDFLRPPYLEKLNDSEDYPHDHQDEVDDTPHQQQSFDELPPDTSAQERGRQSILDRLPVGKVPIMEEPVNMADRNGRGVAPSRSMPMGGGPRSRLNSGASVPVKPTSANTNPKNGKRPQSLDTLWRENLKQKNSPESGNSRKSITRMTEASRKPMSFNSTASSASSESGGIQIPKRKDSSLLSVSSISACSESVGIKIPKRKDSSLLSASSISASSGSVVFKIPRRKDRNPISLNSTASSASSESGGIKIPERKDSSLLSASTSSSSRQPVRGVKKTRSMEGLSSTKNPSRSMPIGRRPRSLDRVPVAKGSTMEATSSSHSHKKEPERGSSHSHKKEPERGSSHSHKKEPERGVKETRSLGGIPKVVKKKVLPKVAKTKELVPSAKPKHSLQSRNTYNRSDSESESESDSDSESDSGSDSAYSSEPSIDSEFECPERAVPKKIMPKAGKNTRKLDKRMVDDVSSSEESDLSEHKVAVTYQKRKKNSKTKLLETKPKSKNDESDSDESIPAPPRKKKSSKEKRPSASASELKYKGTRGRNISKERKTVRSISMDGKVTTKTWWELEKKPKSKNGDDESYSDESISVPPRKKKSSKKKRPSASDGALKGTRGRKIPEEHKTVRSRSMEGKVTNKSTNKSLSWWELNQLEKFT
jgi:hypothetical protein